MTLVDTSAWVEWLRRTESDVDRRLDALLGAGSAATTDPVLMEILAGGRDGADRNRLKQLLMSCMYVPVERPRDFEAAALVYAACRAAGETIRTQLDCLIASVAIRAGCPLLHADSDFERIARHAPLELA